MMHGNSNIKESQFNPFYGINLSIMLGVLHYVQRKAKQLLYTYKGPLFSTLYISLGYFLSVSGK